MTLSTWDFASATRNRLLNQTESVAGTTTRSWTYGYDPADRLTQALASPGGAYAYTLDAADNLLGIQTPTGTASSTYNALNQLVQRRGQPFTHDAADNLTDDGTRTYAWDAEQRLARFDYTGTSRFTAFRHDGLGRRRGRRSGRVHFTSWLSSKIGIRMASTITSTAPPMARISAGSNTPSSTATVF